MKMTALFLAWFCTASPQPAPLAELQSLYQDLTGSDGGKAYRAMWSFTAMPKEAMPFLAKKIKPPPDVDAKLVDKLVSELNSEHFALRQRAMRELEKLGILARPALRRALTKDTSEEFRRRAEQLLNVPEKPVPPEFLRIIEVFERIGNAEAQEHLRRLAEGAYEDRLTRQAMESLQRLRRQSPR